MTSKSLHQRHGKCIRLAKMLETCSVSAPRRLSDLAWDIVGVEQHQSDDWSNWIIRDPVAIPLPLSVVALGLFDLPPGFRGKRDHRDRFDVASSGVTPISASSRSAVARS